MQLKTSILDFDYFVYLFRIALSPSAGNGLTSWHSDFVVLLYAASIVFVPYPFGVWAGCGIRFYRFQIIAFSSTFQSNRVCCFQTSH